VPWHVNLINQSKGHGGRKASAKSLARYAETSAAVRADLTTPFFADSDGLLLCHAWESPQVTFDHFMSPDTSVVWLGWVSALAAVWADEKNRQEC
jgi:hypothetical protein